MMASGVNPLYFFRAILCLVLIVCAVVFVGLTWHWPFVGDAVLMHYPVLLMQHGMAPYRDIVDMNMPGSYFVSWAVSHIFGNSSPAWRIFDFSLSGVAALAMIAIALPYDWLAGIYAAVLLMVIHGRDGVAQASERDLIMAVLLLAGLAFLFHALRRNKPWAMVAFGLCAGIAAAIKPTVLPFAPVLLLLACFTLRRRKQPFAAYLFTGALGFVAPLAAAAAFLLWEHSLGAFIGIMQGLAVYHASLGRRSIGYLLNHSFSPLLPLLAVWLILLTFYRRWQWERAALALAVLFGLVSYIAQGKGYPYHRYPLIAFLLLFMGIDFCVALRKPGMPRLLGIIGLIFGTLIMAPVSLSKVSHYDSSNPEFVVMLETDLRSLGGQQLSGRVQCMDTFAGCIATLDRMKLVQDTGFMYDCYFYSPARDTPAANAVVDDMRAKFWRAILNRPPEIFIITNQLCLGAPGNYQKLQLWPRFDTYLAANYSLYAERQPPHLVRWWSHPSVPFGYRIYLRSSK